MPDDRLSPSAPTAAHACPYAYDDPYGVGRPRALKRRPRRRTGAQAGQADRDLSTGRLSLLHRPGHFRGWPVCRSTVGIGGGVENVGSPCPCPIGRGGGSSTRECRCGPRVAIRDGHENEGATDACGGLDAVNVFHRLLAQRGGGAAVATVSGRQGAGDARQRLGTQPLFGAIAVQLVLGISGAPGFTVCDGCRNVYAPLSRPRTGEHQLLPGLPRAKGASAPGVGAVSE